jgi:hypothetical protein
MNPRVFSMRSKSTSRLGEVRCTEISSASGTFRGLHTVGWGHGEAFFATNYTNVLFIRALDRKIALISTFKCRLRVQMKSLRSLYLRSVANLGDTSRHLRIIRHLGSNDPPPHSSGRIYFSIVHNVFAGQTVAFETPSTSPQTEQLQALPRVKTAMRSSGSMRFVSSAGHDR